MKVPLAARAEVDPRKIREYLLNPDHQQNGGKAALFEAFGFSSDLWLKLQAALERHVVENEVADTAHSPYGVKYVVSCNLRTPDGRDPCMTSVWIIEPGNAPRLVTAYQ